MLQSAIYQGLGVALGAAVKEIQSVKVDAPTKITAELDVSICNGGLVAGKLRIIVETAPTVSVEGKQ